MAISAGGAIPTIDPGAMTARMALERPVAAGDGQGGAVMTFEPVRELWARLEPLAAPVEERAGAEVFVVTHRIWINFRADMEADMEAGMRFRRGIRRFVVKAWRDPDETGRYLVCDCEEGRR